MRIRLQYSTRRMQPADVRKLHHTGARGGHEGEYKWDRGRGRLVGLAVWGDVVDRVRWQLQARGGRHEMQ